ncbi:MAG: hypothetical protein ABGU97_01735 [Xylella fastidiosa subsp. multiplex]
MGVTPPQRTQTLSPSAPEENSSHPVDALGHPITANVIPKPSAPTAIASSCTLPSNTASTSARHNALADSKMQQTPIHHLNPIRS